MKIEKLKSKFFTGAWLTDVKQYFSKINEIIDYLNGVGKSGDGSYKSYVALLEQNNTNIPTAIVLENTLGGPITFTYNGVGNYDIKSNGLFTLGKTGILHGNQADTATLTYVTDINTINLTTVITTTVPANDMLFNLLIEIRVYN